MKRFLFAAAALMALAACSSDNFTTETDEERVPVRLTYNTLDAIETRAAQNLNEGTFDNGETVKVRISNAGEGDWTNYDFTTGDAGAMIAPIPGPYYPAGSTNIDIVAFYPATAGTSFTVATDQTADASYKASDLMFASVENQPKQAAAVELAFTHKMAKLDVNITAGEGIGSINSVSILNIRPTVSFSKVTGNVGAATGDAVNIAVSNNGSALIPAQTVSGNLLSIVTDQGTAIYKFNVDKNLEAGQRYLFDITVNLRAIGTTNAITNWVNGNKLIPTVTAPTANTLTYTGSPQELITAGATTGGEMQYKLNDGEYSTAIPTATNAGDYTVWYKVVGDNDYTDVDEASVMVTIAKVTPTITAPTAKTMIYTGNAQNLITAGTSDHGTFTYSTTEDGTYTTTIPQATNAGNYTVWYKFTGDVNHTDINATQVTGISIAKVPATLTCTDLNAVSFSSNESINTEKNKENVSCTGGYIEVTSGNTGNCTVSYSSAYNRIHIYRKTSDAFTNTTVTVRVVPDDNHTAIASVSFNVSAVAYVDPGVPLGTLSQLGYIVTTDAMCYASPGDIPANKTKAGVVVYKEANGYNGYVVSLFNIGCTSTNSSISNGTVYPWRQNSDYGVSSYTPKVKGYSWRLGTKAEYTIVLTSQWSTVNGYITRAGGRALDNASFITDGTTEMYMVYGGTYQSADYFTKNGEWFNGLATQSGWVRPILFF